jgi:hypothetical protein
VSAKVSARSSALNIAGGVKVDVFVRCRYVAIHRRLPRFLWLPAFFFFPAYVIFCRVVPPSPMNSRELATGASSVVTVNSEKKEIQLKAEKAPTEPFVFDQARASC